MNIEVTNVKDVKMTLAKLSRVMRKSQSLSRSELAEQLNISRITIQNLEAGQNVTIDTVLKVLQHFDLLEKVNTFLTEEVNNQSHDSLY